ncbi:hypothetical protein OAL00_02290 [Verrucomicrobiales bacterium]|nr:hypothetical protein [Verrucomicrobiales bacterium]
MSGHTSIIHLKLDVNGELFKITHLGPDYFRLEENPMIPKGTVKLHKLIDGNHDIWEIELKSAIPANCMDKISFTPVRIIQDIRVSAHSVADPVSA